MDHVWFVSCYDEEKQHKATQMEKTFILNLPLVFYTKYLSINHIFNNKIGFYNCVFVIILYVLEEKQNVPSSTTPG